MNRPALQIQVVLREGTVPGTAVYSSGPDEIYVQAELLLLLEKINADSKMTGKKVFGFYDIVHDISKSKFLKSYRNRLADRNRLDQLRNEIRRKGWKVAVESRGGRLELKMVEEPDEDHA